MKTTLALAILLSLTACVSDDDLDGLDNPTELELGTDPENADTDGDGLSDYAEVYLGTDPLMADTDQDGFDDDFELDHSSDPLDWLSYPWGEGIAQWPDNRHRAEVDHGAPGFDLGQQAPDLELVDQYGNEFSLHQFWGHVVLIDYSAGWCGPSRTLAEASEALFAELAPDGFTFIHVMADDNHSGGGITDPRFLEGYAEEYGLTHPVARDQDHHSTHEYVVHSDQYTGGIPFLLLLDQHMVVVDSATGHRQRDEVPLAEVARELLGAPTE